MQPLADGVPSPTSTALLTIQGEGGAWGIPTSAVASVGRSGAGEAAGADADRESPHDLLTLLGVATAPAPRADSRVLVLDVAGQRARLLVHGTLQLAEAAVAELLPLPPAVRAQTPLLSHLAVIDGKPALFVVSPERLLQAALSAPTPSPHAAQASARGSSC
jgi:hypothetical protein